jgi:hypothetical protein
MLRETGTGTSLNNNSLLPPHSRPDIKKNSYASPLIMQCSNAKKIGRTVTVNDCASSETGPVFTTGIANLPRIGNIFEPDRDDYSKIFHGARLMKNGAQSNEVMTSSFDPKTLNCLACNNSHSILQPDKPMAICFSDQNFVSTLCCGSGSGQTCIAVVRYEDATLSDLTNLAFEMLQNKSVPPGSVILLGSVSHLFKVGAGTYAADWIRELSRLEQRFKNVNICPLAPIFKDPCPGPVVQDLEALVVWFHMVYENNIKGLLLCWDAVLHFAQISARNPSTDNHEVLLKIPLPANIRSTETHPTMIRFFSSDPAILPEMSCTVIKEILNILLSALQSNFSFALDPEVILPRVAISGEDLKLKKHVVCIGSSILKQLIPHLQAAGYTVTDLTIPGWVASEENINSLIKKLSDLKLEPGFSVILDVFGNGAYRYGQFDGTQSLPFKENGRYHYAGPVTLCGDDIFRRIIKLLGPVLLSAQTARKIVIPPLPRYVFNTCCGTASHCTNFSEESYAESILNGVSRLRGILKKECANLGMRNHWTLDGIGALLGTNLGESYGTNKEALPELRAVLAKDGVHLEPAGNRNVSKAIIEAIEKLAIGYAQSDPVLDTGSGSGFSGGCPRKEKSFFWRGFSSPTGDAAGRVRLYGDQSSKGGRLQRAYHPYKRK